MVMSAQAHGSAQSDQARRPARLLLAEDDAEFRSLVAAALREDGHDVLEAADGAELLERVAAEIDNEPGRQYMIVADICMPQFSALDILVALGPAVARTPVVLMTAFGDARTHMQAERLGAKAVFDKPFDIDDLRTAVLHVLSQPPSNTTRIRP